MTLWQQQWDRLDSSYQTVLCRRSASPLAADTKISKQILPRRLQARNKEETYTNFFSAQKKHASTFFTRNKIDSSVHYTFFL